MRRFHGVPPSGLTAFMAMGYNVTPLTATQMEVLSLMAVGCSIAEITAHIGISPVILARLIYSIEEKSKADNLA